MKNIFILLFYFMLPFSGLFANDSVWLRVKNATGGDLTGIKLSERYDFGALKKGDLSKYQEVSGMYRYSYAVAYAGKTMLKCQPIDFVGETQLEPGYYTYVLTSDGAMLDISCQSDPAPNKAEQGAAANP